MMLAQYICHMVRNTKRDQIWQFTVKQTIRANGRTTVDDVLKRMPDLSRTTARDTLNTMAEYEIIERRSNMDGSVYYTANQSFANEMVENL